MPRHALILGGGIIGLCSGYYLLRRGFAVTILDRSDESFEGCSFGNAGLVCPSHIVPLAAPGMVGAALRMMLNPRSPFYVRPRLDRELFNWAWKFRRAATVQHVKQCAPLLRDLHVASRDCYEQIAAEGGNDFGLQNNGLLMLCKTQRGLEHESGLARRAKELGLAAEVLDARQTAQMEPGLQMEVAGAVYFPGDCHLSPGRLMPAMRRRLREAGATFMWDTEVLDWRAGNGTIGAVRTSAGELTADEFILCGGAWSAALARRLGLSLPMQAGKGYSLTLPNPPALPKIPTILTEARVAVTPMDGGLRFGGTMEIGGLNHKISRPRIEGIVRSVPAYYPQFTPKHFKEVKPWCGLRPCSPDGLPYVGRSRRYTNLSIATGHAMTGISLGPVTGKLIAQIVAGEPPEIDIRLLDPDRYH